MAFDYEAARAEGYSDAEIADYLAKQSKFDIQGARKEGYSSEEILGHLAPTVGFEYKKPTPQPGAQAGSARYGTRPTDQQTEYTQDKTSNPLKGLFARAASIAGEGIEGVARVAESAGDYMESKIPLSGLTEEQIKNERQLEPLFKFAQSAKNWAKAVGYEPSIKLNELSDNPLKAVPFIAERLISSSPDMAAAVYAAPAYFTSRTNEILNDRIKNDEKTLDDVTVGDVTAAAGAAALELTLERFATKHILKGAPITGKNAYTRTGKELAFQSATEGLEEGVGYLGGAAGTKKGVDSQELSQQMLEGAIVGGGLGGAVKGTQEYYDYRQKKKAALMAEGVDEDIAEQTLQANEAKRDSMEQAQRAQAAGETDLDKLSEEYFRREYGEPEVAVEQAAPPVAEAAPPVEPPKPENPFAQGMQNTQQLEEATAEIPAAAQVEMPEVILQNRDRSTPASINQMQSIAADPDYKRLGTNTVATVGAPIVFGGTPIAPQYFGKQEVVTDERGNRYPMQYAVVEADEMMPSNNADGSNNPDYANFQGLRAIGGNGRLAGLQEAYQRNTADTYRQDLMADENHGIDPAVIADMQSPVLVRLMDSSMVNKNTADDFNVAGTARLSTVEQAANDTRRVDFTKMETDESGRVTTKAIKEFINAMPESEMAELLDDNGQPTKNAIERFEAAVFQQAYKNPSLVAIAFESADAEARNIIKALTNIAPKVMQLEGTEYDISKDLVTAVEKAITARRDGISLEDASVQMAIGEGPLVQDFMEVFRDNARSAKAMTTLLNDFVTAAYQETTQPTEGLFGETPRRPVSELKQKLKPVQAQDLFAEAPKVEEKKSEAKEERKPEVDKENAEALEKFATELMGKGKRTESVKTVTVDGKAVDQWTVSVVANLSKAQAEFWDKNFGSLKKAVLVDKKNHLITVELNKTKTPQPVKSGRKYTLSWNASVESIPADVRAEKMRDIYNKMQELNRSTERFPGANYDLTQEQVNDKYRMATPSQIDADIKRLDNSLKKAAERKAEKTQELWRDTKFAGRIEKILTDLRNAGADDFAKMLNRAFNNEAAEGKLDEKGVAFREDSARKEIARLGERKPIKYQPMTIDKLGRLFAELKTLPVEIQQSAVDLWNEAAPKLYEMGFRYRETQGSRDKVAQDLDKKLNSISANLRYLAGRRYENAMLDSRDFKTEESRIKAYENSEKKLAEAEVLATETLGMDTAKYPGVDTSRPMDIYGDYKEPLPGERIVSAEDLHKILEEAPKKEAVAEAAEEAPLGASDQDVSAIAEDFSGAMESQEDEDGAVTHVFDPPHKDEVVRLDEKTRVYVAEKGWMTPAEAKKEIKAWKDNVKKQGRSNKNGNKIVLSLFDLSGEWSKPWEEAGYTVFRFDIQDADTYTDSETGEEKIVGDINNFSVQFFNDLFGDFDGNDVYAVLAACPCTDFASSGARHFAVKDASGQTVNSVELVQQTLRTIEYFKPQVWAIENPVGRIEKLTGLPPWRLSFNPNQFGDPYTKRTLLWGRFNADLPIAPVEPTEGSKMWSKYGGKSLATKNARSVTPEGFAYAFFQANNAIDHPVMAIANKYDRLDTELFTEAVNAGLTYDEINSAVEDPYYMDMDDEQAAQNLVDAIAEKTGEVSGNWSITLRQPLNNAKNDDIRREQITELQSMKQRMSAIQRRLAKGKLETLDESTYASLYRRSAALRDAIRATYEPNTTPEKFMADAAQQLAKGEIEQEVFDVIDYMYRKQPNILDGLRLSVRKHKTEMGSAAGQFNGLSRIVTLFKQTEGVWDAATIRHELCHSLEQMMPEPARVRLHNAWREALLRAQRSDKSEAGQKYFEKVAAFLERPSQVTKVAAIQAMPNTSYYQYLTPSEFWAVNAEPLMAAEMGGAWSRFKKSVRKMYEAVKHIFGVANHYDVMRTFDQVLNGERMSQMILDDYFINTGFAPVFSISKRQNYEGGKPPDNTWTAQFPVRFKSFNNFLNKYKEHWFGSADTNWLDTRIYNTVDKYIDLKRVQTAIGKIQTRFDAYMKETLYHGRVATALRRFEKFELNPILEKMAKYGVTKDELNEYRHNLHAEEYNNHINKINPNAQNGGPLQDRGSGISTDDARAYLANLDPAKRKKLEELSDMLNKIVHKTQDVLVEGGIEKAETIKGWRKAFPNYSPLYRTELDFANTSSDIGRGFSTQAGFGKAATGSLKDVDDIFSSIAAQRERAVVRSQKAEISRAIFGLALQNPNTDFWLPVDPTAIKDKEKLYDRLRKMGLEAESVGKNLVKEPEVPYIDANGMVAYRPNSVARNSDSVLAVPVNGETKYIFFNPSDPRALRMVKALKNMDVQALEGAWKRVAVVTRWIAAVNTQYNPVFGLWNFWRDVQGANLNLTNTEIAGQQWEVSRPENLVSALRGIYTELRNFREGKVGGSKWANLWNEFIEEGGQTGYRDQFAKTEEQASIIDRKINELQKQGIKHIPAKLFVEGVGGWMSDFNETLENAVRLSAYRVAKEKIAAKYPNMSDAEVRAKSAELAKNLTVNFNRKGAKSQNRNALYAFYNAAVQGTARMYETLTGPKGKVIMGSLLGLGVAQSLWMAMAGYDEDEPPEFIRERNLVIPLPNGQYAMWPMPLGFNVFVNVGRLGTDAALNALGRKGKSLTKSTFDLMSVVTDSFNPLGGGELSLQTFAPTVADPLVAIATNKDAFGRPIYKEDQATNPIPGYMRAREGAYEWSKLLAQGLNMLSGGTKYQKGLISPTPEELEYIAGQATGGAGRELGKSASFLRDLYTGEETAPYKIPVAGRLYGDIKAQANVANRFYENVVTLSNYEHEIKGRQKNKEDVQEFLDKHPEAKLWNTANKLENQISKLKKARREAFEKQNSDRVHQIDDQIKRMMDQFNRRVEDAKR